MDYVSVIAVNFGGKFLVKKYEIHILHHCEDVLTTYLDKQIGRLLWTQNSQRLFIWHKQLLKLWN